MKFLLPLLLLASCARATVTLPIEVMGAGVAQESASVTLGDADAASVTKLRVQVHGRALNRVSIQVNAGDWVAVSNSTVTVLGNAAKYGGIGGAFRTLTFEMPCAARAGTNTISFRWNGGDPVTSGFRVLSFNLVDAAGVGKCNPCEFSQEDPSKWTAPLPGATDIAEGQRLFQQATLNTSPLVHTPLAVTCSGCHFRDASDLKYFQYSNKAIIQRCMYHGLSETQGQQVASYIRSLPITPRGNPWDPPFQPGPGLDAKPTDAWMAGAGLSAVLDDEAGMRAYLFPNGIAKDAVATSGHLNAREIPVALEFPSWNEYLPAIHPADAWGSVFTSSELLKRYDGSGTNTTYTGPTLRARYAGNVKPFTTLSAYLASVLGHAELGVWQSQMRDFVAKYARAPGVVWTPELAQKVYSTGTWQLVKLLEMSTEFRLYDHAADFFGPTAERATIFGSFFFTVSPFMQGIPNGPNGVGGSAVTNEYLANVWYAVQLATNAGNGVPDSSMSPMDAGYTWGHFADMWRLTGASEFWRFVLTFCKVMQEFDNVKGLGPQAGWAINSVSPLSILVHPALVKMWPNSAYPDRPAVLSAIAGAWFDKSKQFQPSDYWAKGLASQTEIPMTTNGYLGPRLGDTLWYFLSVAKANGVDATLVGQMVDWAQTVWPAANWSVLKTAPVGGGSQ